jgi:hypothetical protein
MDAAAFEAYIKERYRPEIAWYDSKSKTNRIWYNILQGGLTGLAAITPVMIALEFLGSLQCLKWFTLATAVAVALLSTILKTFKFEENWINYRTTCETLKKEIHFYNAGVDDYERAGDKEALFVKRVEALISRENTLWLIATKRQPDNQ